MTSVVCAGTEMPHKVYATSKKYVVNMFYFIKGVCNF